MVRNQLLLYMALLHLIIGVGSSRGRGTRGAAWFADHIESEGDDKMRSLVLIEGIKGWAISGAEYVALMDEYVKDIWEKTE